MNKDVVLDLKHVMRLRKIEKEVSLDDNQKEVIKLPANFER